MLNPETSPYDRDLPRRLGTVLIVEDDGLISMTMEMTVRELGAERVEVFGNPVDARCAAREGSFDCAILDVYMATGSTYELADILATRNIPFLFCTGLTKDDLVERHRHRPMLAKPYSEDELRGLLMQVIGA